MDPVDLQHRFNFPPHTDERWHDAQEALRLLFIDTALTLNELLPSGRHKEMAVERMEEAMFWANSAILSGSNKRPPPKLGLLKLTTRPNSGDRS